jgi:hypothetical protein
MASRRKRGPVALRLQLWLDLPLSNVTKLYAPKGKSRQFGDVLNWSESEARYAERRQRVNDSRITAFRATGSYAKYSCPPGCYRLSDSTRPIAEV